MALKKKDFVELEYTGRLKETNEVFDTTSEAVARENNIWSEKAEYKPIIICIGEGHIIPGIDSFLEGKEPGKYTLNLPPERAFGKKDPKLIRMIPTNKFFEQNIKPVPGLRVNINGLVGTIRAVTGGRTIVDFNHPLSGRDVVYELNILRVVTDKKTQVQALLKVLLGIKEEVELEGNTAKLKLPKLPQQIKDELSKKIEELTGLKTIFEEPEGKKKGKTEGKEKEKIEAKAEETGAEAETKEKGKEKAEEKIGAGAEGEKSKRKTEKKKKEEKPKETG